MHHGAAQVSQYKPQNGLQNCFCARGVIGRSPDSWNAKAPRSYRPAPTITTGEVGAEDLASGLAFAGGVEIKVFAIALGQGEEASFAATRGRGGPAALV